MTYSRTNTLAMAVPLAAALNQPVTQLRMQLSTTLQRCSIHPHRSTLVLAVTVVCVQVAKISPAEIVLYGRSLGSGPTVDLASRLAQECPPVRINGVLLQSPLSSAIRTQCCSCCAITLCCIDMFKSVNKADKIECPVLILHGTEDVVVRAVALL